MGNENSEQRILLKDQVVLVTGAGRGLGRAYAKILAERGATVVVHDAGVAMDGSGSDPSVADAVVREIREARGHAMARYENLESRDACEELIRFSAERFGRLDALVHNAGLTAYAGIEDTPPEVWERLWQVNAGAAFWLCRAAFPIMRQQRYGRIVLTVSGVAFHTHDLRDLAAYATGKGAQFGLMNALAAEGQPHGIRVNAISPVAATRMLRRPVGPREMRPEEVAPGVVFLASSHCEFSGVVLRATNGRFSIGRYEAGAEVDLGPDPTPEAVAVNWRRIIGSKLHS